MNGRQIVLGGVVAGVLILIFSLAISWVTQVAFHYTAVDLAGMRGVTDPVSVLFFVYPWILGFSIAYVYALVASSFTGSQMRKGLQFGLIMWLVVSFTSAFLVYSSMSYPVGFTVNSLVGPLIYLPVAGVVLARIIKQS